MDNPVPFDIDEARRQFRAIKKDYAERKNRLESVSAENRELALDTSAWVELIKELEENSKQQQHEKDKREGRECNKSVLIGGSVSDLKFLQYVNDRLLEDLKKYVESQKNGSKVPMPSSSPKSRRKVDEEKSDEANEEKVHKKKIENIFENYMRDFGDYYPDLDKESACKMLKGIQSSLFEDGSIETKEFKMGNITKEMKTREQLLDEKKLQETILERVKQKLDELKTCFVSEYAVSVSELNYLRHVEAKKKTPASTHVYKSDVAPTMDRSDCTISGADKVRMRYRAEDAAGPTAAGKKNVPGDLENLSIENEGSLGKIRPENVNVMDPDEYYLELKRINSSLDAALKDVLETTGDYPRRYKELLEQQPMWAKRGQPMKDVKHKTTTPAEELPEVPARRCPITQEEARFYSENVKFLMTPFSQLNYFMQHKEPGFLRLEPKGIDIDSNEFSCMASVVQALASIPWFSVKLVCGLDSKERKLLNALSHIYKYMWVKWENSNPADQQALNGDALRHYYTEYKSEKFPAGGRHNIDDFLEDLILTLEKEVPKQEGDNPNVISNLFRGYITSPGVKPEEFRILRLNVADSEVNTIDQALHNHLLIRPCATGTSAGTSDESRRPKLHPKLQFKRKLLVVPPYPISKPVNEEMNKVPVVKEDEPKEYKKLTPPRILCVSLVRNVKNDTLDPEGGSLDDKIIPLEKLVLSAELMTTNEAVIYNLMSTVYLVNGIYYTFYETATGSFTINGKHIEGEMKHTDGFSVLFIYAERPLMPKNC